MPIDVINHCMRIHDMIAYIHAVIKNKSEYLYAIKKHFDFYLLL